MSLVTFVFWVTEREPGITGEMLLQMNAQTRQRFSCLYCGNGLDFPFVYWHGYEADITLHPNCAQKLGAHLIGDAREGLLTTSARERVLDNIEIEAARLAHEKQGIL